MVKKLVMVSFLIGHFFKICNFQTFFFWAKIYFFFTPICGHKLRFCGHLWSKKYTFFFETIILSNLVIFLEVVTIVSYQNPEKKVYFFSLPIVNIKLFYYLLLFLDWHLLIYGLKFNIYDILFRKKKYIFQKKSIFGRNMVYFSHFPSFSRIRKWHHNLLNILFSLSFHLWFVFATF